MFDVVSRMMSEKTEQVLGNVVVAVLAACTAWSALATALTLQMYLNSLEPERFPPMDLMVEIDCLASSFNLALPVAVLAIVAGGVLARRRKLPVLAAGTATALFFISLAPAIPLMNHFDRIHGEDINIWGNHVWWLPE